MKKSTDTSVRVGVVGCGVVATAYYLPYLMEHAELVAVCDADPARAEACQRLFGVRETYPDYEQMLQRADLDAVFILTGPGPHAEMAVRAAEAGKHVLLQKPMALTLPDCEAIVQAVRKAGVKAVIEPSDKTVLDPMYAEARALVDAGVLGDPYWFSVVNTTGNVYHPSLGGNPYGMAAFYAEESGGILFDLPYMPAQITTLFGNCTSVMGSARLSVPEREIVPDTKYTEFLAAATDPHQANYWEVVCDLPKTEQVTMGAPDNVFSLYEMESGWSGVFHCGRPFHPMPPEIPFADLQVFGRDGNMIFGGASALSVISSRKDLLPGTDEHGWYRIPYPGHGAAKWPIPRPGAFNYYHASTRHLLDCIAEDRDPLINVEWGRHITEMLTGAIESSRTGTRYEMTTTLTGMRTGT